MFRIEAIIFLKFKDSKIEMSCRKSASKKTGLSKLNELQEQTRKIVKQNAKRQRLLIGSL